MKKIVVVGSLNMDLVIKVNRMPKIGETIKAEKISYLIGGKGANQAVAASRLGVDTTLLGCVGSDAFGEEIIKHLKNEGLNMEYVKVDESAFTGQATILKTPEDNSIVVIPGANDFCNRDFIIQYEDVIKEADILITQLEIPLDTVNYALEIAKKYGTKTILNPAPAIKLSKETLKNVDILTPNETEFELISGGTFENSDDLEKAMITWQKENDATLIVTRGSFGSSFVKEEEVITIRTIKVEVVDTTGAGDTFNGALASSLVKGYNMEDSVRIAGIAASLSVTKFGAQGGMPTEEELKKFI